VRHETIHEKALLIDKFVDIYMRAKKRKTFPHKEVGQIIHWLFPNSKSRGRGTFKTVYQISSRERDLVLKISKEKSIRNDIEAYDKLPRTIRNRYFAKVYWNTKYCLLQKYGKAVKVSPKVVESLKRKVRSYGLCDVRADNIRKVNGIFKIVDATVK